MPAVIMAPTKVVFSAFRAAVFLVSLFASTGAANATSYPTQIIKIVVGFAAGGPTDTVCRIIADKLSKQLGQTIIVENRPGAGGAIAAEQFAKALPDGHTLLFLPSAHSSVAAMRKSLPFDPVADFEWITLVATYPLVFAVRKESPFSTFAEVIAAGKTRPGSMSYYSVGVGTGHHLMGEWLNAVTGVEFVHIPYRGSSAAIGDLLSGRIDLMIDTTTFAIPQAKGGTIRALAVTSPASIAGLPGVPPASTVIPDFEYESWIGFAAPRGTPTEIVAKLNSEIARAVALPEVAAAIDQMGAVPKTTTPAEFRNRVASDIAKFREIVSKRNIQQQD